MIFTMCEYVQDATKKVQLKLHTTHRINEKQKYGKRLIVCRINSKELKILSNLKQRKQQHWPQYQSN